MLDHNGNWCCGCGSNSGHTSERQCAQNRAATAEYMATVNGFRRSSGAESAQANLRGIRDRLPDLPTGWDAILGTQHDPEIIAVRSPRYRETGYGDVIFLTQIDAEYESVSALCSA